MKVNLDDITAMAGDDGKGKRETGKEGTAPLAGVGPARRATPSGITVHAQSNSEPVPDEINVIGLTVAEATERVDKFLDQAALAGKQRLRIIHGHGTGALRRGLGAFLGTHPLVEGIAAEDPERGGTAITVVTLRGT
jgi:DNA mismatch repair protein MutS2